jgi:hypothetical protein
MKWSNQMNLTSFKYVCGYCKNVVASEKGWFLENNPGRQIIYICPNCQKPSYFEPPSQIPGLPYGNDVSDIDDENTKLLYDEARNYCSTESYTASVLACRKLLMNIAVSKGAATNLSFFKYVEFLADNNYIPPDAKDWVDHIRIKGNEATHEIHIMQKEDAEELLNFIEMLLRIIYEFPAKIKSKTAV